MQKNHEIRMEDESVISAALKIMTDRRTDQQTDGKVTSAPMGALEVKLNSLLVNYD